MLYVLKGVLMKDYKMSMGDAEKGQMSIKIDALTGEVKSMRTARQHLGKGVGSCVLQHIVNVAKQRGYSQLLLETGSAPEYALAYALYEKFGFAFCGPFAGYREDPHCRFMMLQL